MERRNFLKLAGGALTAAAVNLSGMNSDAARPNFLFILSDDHGIIDAGCYGNPVIKTPNIDALANEGLLFSRAFTPAAMCAPSRSSLFTGLNPHRHGCYMNHGSVSEEVQSIPHYLGQLGYRVGLAGKTHIKPKEAFPFEYMPLTLDAIEDFMSRSNKEPFCLFVATNDPHAEKIGSRRGFRPSSLYDPNNIPLPPYLVDTAETREQRAGYYDLVTRLDSLVGDISALVDNLNVSNLTLLTYASDHGASFPFEKWTCYEAGLNLPMIMRWPGRIKSGTQTDAMISFIDVVPTLVDLAGGSPTALKFDGRSFKSVILENSTKHHEYIFGTHTTEGIVNGSYYPVRSIRNMRYKYIQNTNSDGAFTNIITASENQAGWGSWVQKAEHDPFAAKQVRLYQKRPLEEVYDLKHDPHEMRNLNADPAYNEIKTDLKVRLTDWMHSQNDPELAHME